MSVRVNLLPQETAERQAAARQRGITVLVVLLLVALLGAAYWWQLARVSDARDELATEEEQVAELQGEVAALSEFEELRIRHEDTLATISTTLDGESSVAGILQDLAAVMPTDTQLDTLGLVLNEAGVDDATGTRTAGNFTANGQTLTSHAPGVERLLLSLDKVAAFRDLHVNSSTLEVEDEDFATFSVDGQLGPEILTRRYENGLPEELR